MGEFFKGWRRKVGLVTLAMACVLITGWMRSYGINDQIIVRGPQNSLQLIQSFGGGICWQRWALSSETFDNLSIGFEGYYDVPATSYPWSDLDVEWRRNWAGFTFGEATSPSNWQQTLFDRVRLWRAPYWSLVLPLTLLSAWLILGKPRKVKPAADLKLPAREESIQ